MYQKNRDAYEGGQLHQFCSKCLWWQSGHGVEIFRCARCDAPVAEYLGLVFGGSIVEFDGVRFIFHDRQNRTSVKVDRADYPDVISFMLRHAIEQPLVGELGKGRPMLSGEGDYLEKHRDLSYTKMYDVYWHRLKASAHVDGSPR